MIDLVVLVASNGCWVLVVGAKNCCMDKGIRGQCCCQLRGGWLIVVVGLRAVGRMTGADGDLDGDWLAAAQKLAMMMEG